MNTPVSFEIAKLLKEKGFNNECSFFYSVMEGEEGKLLPVTSSLEHIVEYSKKGHKFFDESTDRTLIHQTLKNDYAKGTVTAPTIAEVVMWAFEKHGIWISVFTMDKWLPNGNDREQLFDYGIKQMKLGLINIPKKFEEFNSPTEAYAAAIEYTLNNLI